MFCEQCGKQIPDTDRFCGVCGWHVPENNPASVTAEAVVPTAIPAGNGKKKSSKLIPIIIGAVALVAVLVIVAVVILPGWFRRKFSSPENYFHYVAKEAEKEYVSNMASVYDDALKAINFIDKKYVATVEWQIGEDLMDMLSDEAEVDLEFLANGSVGANISIGKEVLDLGASVTVNGVDIAAADMIMDIIEDNVYVTIPDFLEKNIGMDMESMGAEIDEDDLEEVEAAFAIFPESKKLESLINKYAGIAIDCIEDVDKDKETIKANGVSQNVTALTVTIDEDTVYNMAEAVLTEMLEDKELESMIVELAESVDEDGEDVYDAFIEEIEEILDDIDYYIALDEDIEFVLYVNDSDEICGFEMEADGVTLYYVMPKSGGKFGYEASMEDYYDVLVLTGSGKESGNKLTGEFSLEYNGMDCVEIAVKDLDADKLKKGYLNGELTFTIPSGMGRMLASEMGMSIDFEDYALKVVSEVSGTDVKLQMEVQEGKDVLVALDASIAVEEQGTVNIPADKNVIWAEDEEEMGEILLDFDWELLLDRLTEADFPSEILDELEYLVDSLEYMSDF